jgi:glyceraldehyde 3-phosphate dehydrogenase
MSIKIAINGFGRIGRSTLRRILKSHSDLEVIAINDLTDSKTLAHLLRYDSIYGIYNKVIKFTENSLLIDGVRGGQEIKIFSEKDPINLPWKELGIDIVLECSGVFTDFESSKKHFTAGAKKIIISAPSKDPDKIPSFVLGVNENILDLEKNDILNMVSCTTNCLAPITKVINDNFKIIKGFMSTIHAYTNDQKILDLPHKDLRRTRAAALNIIPTTTGAAKAIGNIIPELRGKLDGIAFRIPVPVVSLLDFVCEVEKPTTAEEVNYVLRKASAQENLRGILGIEDALLVSTDYIGNSYSAIIDAELTAVKNNLVKIVAWYDNEWAYACRLAEFAEFVGKKIKK